MSKKRKKSQTTKNTQPKPRVTRTAIMGVECNGYFEIATSLDPKVFDATVDEWHNHPTTRVWDAKSLMEYVRAKYPKHFCVLKEDYERVTKNKVISATKEEWEAENN